MTTRAVSVGVSAARSPAAKRKALLISCATAAVAAGVIAPQKAQAQAFNADPTTVFGSVTYNRATAGQETITIGGNNAVVNWAPNVAPNNSGNIDFLPSGNVATYVGPTGNNDFTVLNRILSANPIEMNGHVISNAQSAAAGSGGKIWFYSPTGILVGASAVFDVGSLLLTANNPSFDPETGVPTGFFSAPLDSTAKVSIAAGAKINALTDGNYVALIAPRIEQGGEVRVNGSAAYVAGEQVSMTINDGMFDISVDIGTTDSEGINHTGTTRGISATGLVDNRSIYMVAVPKNEAMTMLLAGDIGYTNATNAAVDNGQIVLSAGHNTFVGDGNSVVFEQATGIQASVDIQEGIYRSPIQGIANTNFWATADEADVTFEDDIWFRAVTGQVMLSASGVDNLLDVNGDASLWAESNSPTIAFGGNVTVSASADGAIDISGDLDARARGFGIVGIQADGGTIDIDADGGDITVGTIHADSSGLAGIPDIEGGSSDAEGGSIRLHAANGGILTSGNVTANASGFGGYTNGFGDGFAGSGTGGSVLLHSELGGLIDINGFVQGTASGEGGDVSQNGQAAGVGRGGSAAIRAATTGDIDISGNVFLTADGIGGDVTSPIDTTAAGGSGYGGTAFLGTISLSALDVGSSITSGDVFLNANGHGGDGFGGGAGYGGGQIIGEVQSGFGAGARAYAGTIMNLGSVNFNAVGTGGNASLGFGGAGGYAQGGTTFLQADSFFLNAPLVEGPGSIITAGNAVLDTSAVGGTGGAGFNNGIDPAIAAGAGGDALGGTHTGADSTGGAHAIADNRGSELHLGNLQLYAVATGGAGGVGAAGQSGGAGGDAIGGTASGGTYRPDTGDIDFDAVVALGDVWIDTSGTGGNGGAGGAGGSLGAGGDGTGGGYCGQQFCGGIQFGARGTLTTGSVTMRSNGTGGSGATGGSGEGGDSTLFVFGGGSLAATGALEIVADSLGGTGFAGVGGIGTGGWSGVLLIDGALSTPSTITIRSSGTGGTGVTGGEALGGTTVFDADALSTASIGGQATLNANANGGFGTDNASGTGGAGGDATGGTSTLTVGGDVTTGILRVVANGFAGNGGNGIDGGDAGSGFGGDSTITINAGGSLDSGAIDNFARGFGGDGGNGTTGFGGDGGNGTGGTSYLTVAAGGTLDAANYHGSGNGGGGYFIDPETQELASSGGNGGTGGSGDGVGGSGASGSVGATIAGTATIAGNFVATAFSSGGFGSTGGDAIAGDSTVTVTGSLTAGGTVQASAQALGGDGEAGAGGAAEAGSATITVDGSLTSARVFVGNRATGGNGTTGGGNAFGGNADFNVNGSATVTDSVSLDVQGIGGNSTDGFGGQGFGGQADMRVNQSATNATFNNIELVADAFGGNSTNGTGGNASAGFAELQASADTSATGFVGISADGEGGDGAAGGGDGLGGFAELFAQGGATVALGPDTLVTASGSGGSSSNGTGGDGQGRYAVVEAQFTSGIEAVNLTVRSNGTGGDGVDGGDGFGGVFANVESPGGARIHANAGQISVAGLLSAESKGSGGDATTGTGGHGQGGEAEFLVLNGGSADLANADINADGFGGNATSGFGGNADAGLALLEVDDDLTVTGETFLSAEGEGGDGLLGGGYGAGGEAGIVASSGGAVTLGIQTNVETEGTGGSSFNGTGGDGLGGLSYVRSEGGSSLSVNDLTVSASAEGGSGVDGGFGIAGTETAGAWVEAIDPGSLLTLSGVTSIEANGTGGAASGGIAGEGQAGLALLRTQGGSISGDAVHMDANGTTDGEQVEIVAEGSGTITLNSLIANANGPGGGDVDIGIEDGSTIDLGTASLSALGNDADITVDLGYGSDVTGITDLLLAQTLTIDATDNVNLLSQNGAGINVGGTFDAMAGTTITLDDATGGATLTATTIKLDASDIVYNWLFDAADIALAVDGDFALTNAPVASNSLTITAGGNVTADTNLIFASDLLLSAGLDITTLDLDASGDLTLIAVGDINTGNLQAGEDVSLATQGAMTTGSVDAIGGFTALGHGDMAFGDVTASEVFLADFSMQSPTSGGGVTGTCVGKCGTLGADGVVIAPPTGSTYTYVTTDAGAEGAGQLPGEGGTNGSSYTTSVFSADAGDDLDFWFNYVTSDGSGFADYAWAALLTADTLDSVAILYTARTQPTGTIVPGQDLPGVEATLNPASVPIVPGAPVWSPLGADSGACFAEGCGFTGWVDSTYQIASAGNYVLRFGVTNWSDTIYQSGMAFSGITVGGEIVTPALTPTLGSITIGNVTTGTMTASAGTTLTAGTIDALGLVDIRSGGNMQTGDISAGQLKADAGGTMTLGALSIGQDATLDAVGNISFVSANVGTEFDFDTAGNINGGNVIGGNRIGGDATGTVTLGDLTVTGGLAPDEDFSVGIASETSSITVGDVAASGPVGFAAFGDLTAGDLTAGQLAMLLVGGDIVVGSVTTDLAGRAYLADFSMFEAAGGSDAFNPSLVLAQAPVPTGGSITINGPVTTGTFQAAAGTDFTAGAITADADIEMRAGGLLTTGNLVAGSDIVAQSGSDLEIGDATAGTSIDLTSGGNLLTGILDAPIVGLTVAGDFTTGDLFVDNSLLLTAGGNLTAGNIVAGGDLSLTAGLNIATLDLTASGDLTLNAAGNVTTGDLTAGSGLSAGAGGDLTVGDASAGQAMALNSGGNIIAGNLDAGTTALLGAGGDFTVGDVSADDATFIAGGLANFNGTVSAPTITVTSADITIAEAGSLGALGVTNLITLNAVSAGDVILGGDGTEASSGQYQLAEAGDIISDAVVFNAGSSDVHVLDVQIDGSQNSDGGVSHVTLNSGGNVFVEGQVNFVDAAATDSLTINGGDSIQVITDTGGISITDSDGILSGTLALTAHDVWIADQATLDQVAAGGMSFEELEQLLSVNNGAVNEAGYVQAGSVDVTMLGSSFLVQNTGTETDLAGLTVGEGGLNIVNQGAEPATVIIFGRAQNSDGSFSSGDDFFDQVSFEGTGGFTGGSNVNGCSVGAGCNPEFTEEPTIGGPESILGPIGLMDGPSSLARNDDEFADQLGEEQDEGEEEEDAEEDGEGGVDAGVGLINTGPVSIETPIDEPVTSGSDTPGGVN